jgi:hypothetical protein
MSEPTPYTTLEELESHDEDIRGARSTIPEHFFNCDITKGYGGCTCFAEATRTAHDRLLATARQSLAVLAAPRADTPQVTDDFADRVWAAAHDMGVIHFRHQLRVLLVSRSATARAKPTIPPHCWHGRTLQESCEQCRAETVNHTARVVIIHPAAPVPSKAPPSEKVVRAIDDVITRAKIVGKAERVRYQNLDELHTVQEANARLESAERTLVELAAAPGREALTDADAEVTDDEVTEALRLAYFTTPEGEGTERELVRAVLENERARLRSPNRESHE